MSKECDTSLLDVTGGTPMGEYPTNPRESKYGSILEPALNPLTLLLKVELSNGSALPRDKSDAGTILAISHQVMGISPYKVIVMLCYWEGNLLGPIVGELMGTTLLEGLPMIISHAIVSPTKAVQIVEGREATYRVGIVDLHPTLTPDHPTPDRSP